MRRLKMPLMAGLFCALAAACAHENTTNGNGTKGNTDTDETVTIFSSTTKEIASGSATRTSISHIHGSGATAFWELGDKIWVEKGGTLRESVSSDITAKTATAKFTLSGTYTAANYMVFYTGANSTAGRFPPHKRKRARTAPRISERRATAVWRMPRAMAKITTLP